MFVNYHLNIGVDHIYLFFDDPTDAAADALARRARVTAVRCDLGPGIPPTTLHPTVRSTNGKG